MSDNTETSINVQTCKGCNCEIRQIFNDKPVEYCYNCENKDNGE
jgi:hypothetical protein